MLVLLKSRIRFECRGEPREMEGERGGVVPAETRNARNGERRQFAFDRRPPGRSIPTDDRVFHLGVVYLGQVQRRARGHARGRTGILRVDDAPRAPTWARRPCQFTEQDARATTDSEALPYLDTSRSGDIPVAVCSQSAAGMPPAPSGSLRRRFKKLVSQT